MGKKKEFTIKSIRLEKLVHGGQCLAEMKNFNISSASALELDSVQGRESQDSKPNITKKLAESAALQENRPAGAVGVGGKKIFAWGGLPGELVSVKIMKQKKTYMEGLVVDVQESSADRINPEEPESYLSTSPWQIMTFDLENKSKQAILEETFEREGIENIPWANFCVANVADASGRAAHNQIYSDSGAMRNPEGVSHMGYRNKMEMGFWGDENGLHLANYVRGTHGKSIVQGSALAKDCINLAAQDLRDELNRLEIWGGKLKTVILRASEAGETVGALFVKEALDMSGLVLPASLKGLDIYYSNPKSPASVASKKLYSFGDITLTDTILGKNITYDVLSFFQVNISMFEQALTTIKKQVKGKNIVDMYSGVGTIGLAVGAKTLVESDENNITMASKNAGKGINVVHATSETALDYISPDCTLIVDPPRAGLHRSLVDKIAEVRPMQIVYLSCNPSTQARDVKLLEEHYKINYAQGYNFFPRTPHIESLIVLEKI